MLYSPVFYNLLTTVTLQLLTQSLLILKTAASRCNTLQQCGAYAINVNQLIVKARKAALRRYSALYVHNVSHNGQKLTRKAPRHTDGIKG